MGQMIVHQKELIRINTPKNCIEYSTNDGRIWHKRANASSSMGSLQDLADNGKEILLTTSKGLFYSTNKGSSWHKRS
ncbi:hypothetical protein ACSVH2_08545 [Flavobacterium sp. RSB2_4_14]|uniref:hypothetical protein n=1 Tax=Flavobacterium sp. RSB2_4_14 TaxID=3447665 RepID=UPI003F3EB453